MSHRGALLERVKVVGRSAAQVNQAAHFGSGRPIGERLRQQRRREIGWLCSVVPLRWSPEIWSTC